jgi:Gnt-I system high-affinity gluconate transporter
LTFLIIILAIALQIFLTYKKVSPFISLLIVAILAGFCLGMQPKDILKSFEVGAGTTLGGIALIICLGGVLGRVLEISGAAEQISTTLINAFGQRYIQWAVLLAGFLIGLPLFYNAGFVIVVPLIFSIARRAKLPLLYIAIPMSASLSTTHCFLPPHPGPVFLVNAFKADIGKTLIYGLIVAIPVVIIAGPTFGKMLRHIRSEVNELLFPSRTETKKLPAVSPSFLFALMPVILITLAVIANNFFINDSILKKIILFIGDPTIALLLSVLLACVFLGIQTGHSVESVTKWIHDGILSVAIILLIITAGGVFKQVLQDSGTGNYISSLSSKWQMPPLLFAWIVTALLRVTIGSATVAGITAAGVLTPLATSGTVSPELMVLAVGTGSVFGSHVNDSAFWMFKEFFNLSLKQTFLSWTVMESAISILGFAGVLLLNYFI